MQADWPKLSVRHVSLVIKFLWTVDLFEQGQSKGLILCDQPIKGFLYSSLNVLKMVSAI